MQPSLGGLSITSLFKPLKFVPAAVAVGAASFMVYQHWNTSKSESPIVTDPHSCDGKQFPTIKLNNGKEIPVLGFGTWCLGKKEDNKFDEKLIYQAIQHAVKIGYRHIDCAQDYLNEHLVGDVLKDLFDKKEIKREELFVTSKLNQPYHSAKHVEMALLKTLKDLQLEYLDLYLIHWPFAFDFVDFGENALHRGWNHGKYDPWDTTLNRNISIRETWTAMEEMVNKGYVKSIGVSNFNVQLLSDLLSYAAIPPVVNQVESHPYLAQSGLVKYCAMNNIVVEAYSPLGSPGNFKKNELPLLMDVVLRKIAKKRQKTCAQIALRWNFMRSNNIVVITKASSPQRISENHSLLDFSLSDDEMKQINALNKNHRYLKPQEWSVTKDIHLFE